MGVKDSGSTTAGALVGAALTGVATGTWFLAAHVAQGESTDGSVLVLGLGLATPALTAVGGTLGAFCARNRWYEAGPAAPAIAGAVLGLIGTDLIRGRSGDIALVALATGLAIVIHYGFVAVASTIGKSRRAAAPNPAVKPTRDALQVIGVFVVAIAMTWNVQRTADESRDAALVDAQEAIALASFDPLEFVGSQGITKVAEQGCSGSRIEYLYETDPDNQVPGGIDLRSQADAAAASYEQAGYTIERWVQPSPPTSSSGSTFVVFAVREGTGVKLFVGERRTTGSVRIDCGEPISLVRSEWRNATVASFPPPD